MLKHKVQEFTSKFHLYTFQSLSARHASSVGQVRGCRVSLPSGDGDHGSDPRQGPSPTLPIPEQLGHAAGQAGEGKAVWVYPWVLHRKKVDLLTRRSPWCLYDVSVLLGEYEKAEPLHHRAIEITEANVGKDHPQLSVHLNNVVVLLEKRVRARVCGCSPRCFTMERLAC